MVIQGPGLEELHKARRGGQAQSDDTRGRCAEATVGDERKEDEENGVQQGAGIKSRTLDR
jgi:hypothetical protein